MQCQRLGGTEENLEVHNGLVGFLDVVKGKRRKKKWMMTMIMVMFIIFRQGIPVVF